MYRDWFFKPTIFAAVDNVVAAAAAQAAVGLTGHAVALRWILHHSALDAARGDAVIVGASSLAQLRENMDICAAGPLSADLLAKVEAVWAEVRHVAPPAHF